MPSSCPPRKRGGRGTPALGALGRLERAVVEHVWATGEADVKATHAAVGKRPRITLNTVGSALKRLHEKGIIKRRKKSHRYVYTPAMTEGEFHALILRRFVDSSMLGDTDAMLRAFIDVAEGVDHTLLQR